ncbi:MAG: peptidoglycan DD-metalloendopeptidase family protein [Giesbergeria sp.]|nr:peptidoglycan DD-metalloendopeptidase family protein [Giesbergeria sp.]
MIVSRGLAVLGSVALASLVLVGCGTRLNKAPIENRGTSANGSAQPGVVTDSDIKLMPGAENAGKPGYYSVKPGDTLIRIGLESGQSWKDVARWNNLENANLIEVGQVLRVIPPVASVAAADSGGVVARPVVVAPVTPAAPTASAPKPANPAASAGEDDVAFIWPSSGTLLAGFDEARNKGYDISGKAGDPVVAAADGRVVYAGAGLRGYGNLIILKHNNTFLTAYAHNQALLVKEDQAVRKGQKIAEMGSTDADRVKLHFEIRRQGKPVDPVRYLPSR